MNKRQIKIGAIAVLGLFAAPMIAEAVGPSQAQPANKASASGRKLVVFGPGEGVELLKTTMKTSKTQDLVLQVSLECSILTQLLTNEQQKSSLSQAKVLVWVEIDGAIVPIEDSSGGTVAGNDSDKVTFCDRTYQRTVSNSQQPGATSTTTTPVDQEADYIRTKSANAFNWLRLNAGSGTHDIVVRATLSNTNPSCGYTTQTGEPSPTAPMLGTSNASCAQAYVGNRTLIVEPTRTANNAVIN